jgi:hypothetical protein
MFASLPFILLLILQGFARHDSAELLLGNQDLANFPVQTRNLKAFDGLLVHFTYIGNVKPKQSGQLFIKDPERTTEIARFSHEKIGDLQRGFLKIQRSRDGPVA